MAASISEVDCAICCEPFNNSTRLKIICPRPDCEWAACKTCIRTFILNSATDPSCMKCFNAFSVEFVVNNLNRSFWKGEYRTHRKKQLLENEISKMPGTMSAATKYKEAMKLETENMKSYKYINELRKKIEDEEANINKNRRRIRRLYWAINNNEELPNEEDVVYKSKKFLMKCSVENCRGYLSSQYKCNICENYTCNKCLECVGEYSNFQTHVCDENNVKTAELVKKETKPCPNCAERIFKIDGCDQMFCTICHSAFSWNTGEIITGVIHNPHYYEWQRQVSENGQAPRAVGDVICGGLIDYAALRYIFRKIFPSSIPLRINDKSTPEQIEIVNLRRKLSSMHRLFAHVIHVSIPDLNNKINNVTNHTYKRINYILNEISKEELQDYIYKQDSIRAKSTELLNIWQLFQVVGIDFFNNLMTIANDWDSKKNDFQNIYNIISENYTFCKYCNEQFAKISITYSQMVPYITNDYYERSTKYKKQKKVNDGSCGGNSPYVMC